MGLKAYFMMKGEFEPGAIQIGSLLEKIAVAINQSEKLIVCLTEELLLCYERASFGSNSGLRGTVTH